MAQFDLKKATIKILDGTGSPNVLILKIAEGTVSFSEKKNRKYTKDRGLLSTVMDGDEEPMDVDFDVIWEQLKQGSGEPVTPEDALKQRGGASGWTSSDPDTCAPYAVDIVIVDARSCGGTQTETITLPDFRWEDGQHDLKSGVIKFKGKCNATQATVVRS